MQQAQTTSNRATPPASGRATAAVCLLALSTPAVALDFEDADDLIIDTVAARERRSHWDETREFGAQTVGEGERGYRRPDGIRVGNFLLFPDIGETIAYDDNIFGTAADPEADIKFITTPRLDVLSQWPRHAFHARITGRIVNYAEHSEQDNANVNALMRTAFEIDHAHTLSLSAKSGLNHEERSETTSPRDAAEHVPVIRNAASIGLTRDAGRLYATLSADIETLDYSDVRAVDGSNIDQDHRDQTIYRGRLRGGYRFSPGYDLISEVRIVRSLAEIDERNGTDRNSTGYEGLVGLAFEQGALINWRVLGGYGYRDYDSAAFEPVHSTLLEVEAQWLVTQRLTFTAMARRALVDEIGTLDSGRIESTIGASAEIELLHNLIATLRAEHTQQDFTGIERVDNVTTASAELEWFAAANWVLSAGFRHETNDSTDPEYDVTRNQVRIGARYRY